MEIYIVLRCYGYNAGEVYVDGAYVSREQAERAAKEAEEADTGETIRDSLWVESIELEQS